MLNAEIKLFFASLSLRLNYKLKGKVLSSVLLRGGPFLVLLALHLGL